MSWRLKVCLLSLLVPAVESMNVDGVRTMIHRRTFVGSFASSMFIPPSNAATSFNEEEQKDPIFRTTSQQQTRGNSKTSTDVDTSGQIAAGQIVAYKPLSIRVGSTRVPVAAWFPAGNNQDISVTRRASYQHRISIRKIGQMLARWDFIPEAVARNYALSPASDFVVDGSDLVLAPSDSVDKKKRTPVILLAHGYLGSRFDLSHLAEQLALRGFVCFAPEYPESLAASYDPQRGTIDRQQINDVLLTSIEREWKIPVSSYGIVGHSLGCGTALQTGDNTWTRVLMSGSAKRRDGSSVPGNMLLITSMNDGLVRSRFGDDVDLSVVKRQMVPSDFSLVEEEQLLSSTLRSIPQRSMLIFDRPDAPNHISFLSESVNDSMIEFLSPLLPVARAFEIPVLDFDRYQISRDSAKTATVVHPIVIRYLQQEMLS